jgi:Kef-type K+ transport system membrane component KefB
MDELTWMPHWPSQFSLLAAAAIMLMAGALGARLLGSVLRLPQITAFLFCGLILGPGFLGVIPKESISGLSLLANLALGVVLFDLGRRVDPGWLKRERWLLITAIVQCLVVFAGVLAVMQLLGLPMLVSLMAASLGSASSPAMILRTVEELHAEGQVTERLIHSVALHAIIAFVLFTASLQALHLAESAAWLTSLSHPIYLLAGSTALGWIAAQAIWLASKLIRGQPGLQQLLVLGFIALLVEANDLLQLSPLVSLLIFGIASRGYGRHSALQAPEAPLTHDIVYAFLFVYLGTTIHLSFDLQTLLFAAVILLSRLLLLIVPAFLLAKKNGLSRKKGMVLGAGLLPISGVSILMVNHAATLYPNFGQSLGNLIAAMLLMTYIFGPLVTRWSLRASGEAKPLA